MAINYATEYKQALAQPFKEGLKSYRLFTEGEQYQFLNAKTIQIPKLSMTGFRTHGRGTALQVADEYSNDWEPKTLAHDRSKYILADIKDIDETNLARSIARQLTYLTQNIKYLSLMLECSQSYILIMLLAVEQ